MTPEQLRARAWKCIESARRLLDSDPDYAAQTVGYAAELALKARFCTRRGWSDFPSNPREAKKRGGPDRLFKHDLDELLKYTDDIAIKTSSMHNVNWPRASDWSVDRRYTPVGTLTQEQAKAQIDETEKLFIELALWETLEKLVQVEIEQAHVRGPFNFFGLVWDQESGGWAAWFAAWGTPAGVKQRLAATVNAIRSILAHDLFAALKCVRSLHPHMPVLQSFYMILAVQHQPRCITSHNVVVGMPAMPSAYIITCVNLAETIVLERVAGLPLHEQVADTRAEVG